MSQQMVVQKVKLLAVYFQNTFYIFFPLEVPLFKGSLIHIDPGHLKLIVRYGSSDKSKQAIKAVVYRIMESIYSDEYMASHSLSGRGKPGNPKNKANPALPRDDVDAIIG